MRLLFVLIFSTSFSVAHSQPIDELPENYVIAWGAAPGWFAYVDLMDEDDGEIRDENNNLCAYGERINGKADGKWTGYFPDGSVQVKGQFDEGIPEGLWTFYWENGNVRAKGHFGPGQFELGCAGSENYITAGAQQGEWVYWYKNRTVAARISYEDNVWDGPYETFYENENPKVIGYYEQGSKNRKWTYYYETGIRKRQEYYKYNSDCMADLGDRVSYECPAGNWTYYDENGNWTHVVTYSSNGEWLSERFPD